MLLLLLACATRLDCAAPAEAFEPGCTEPALEEAGCYVRCDGEGAVCETGSCTLAVVDPCADAECSACGTAEWLCL